MTPIRTTATITNVVDLSTTAREITIRPETPFSFLAGAFVNVFLPSDTGPVRRAYSISSDPTHTDTFTLSIRCVPHGVGSAFFWQPDIVGRRLEVMGPLGRNTSDTLTKDRIFLFGFGIGVSVIKALAHYAVSQPLIQEITIMTGNRNEDDILYGADFESLATNDPRVHFRPVLSDSLASDTNFRVGFIQQHIGDLDFSNASIYICGQPHACVALQEAIHAQGATGSQVIVESF